jgi:hypothetical protein
MGIISGVVGWFGKAYLENQKLEAEKDKSHLDQEMSIERHRDGLTFQLLDAARAELSQMKSEVQKLRPMEYHLYHLQQALEHIEALLSDDPDERVVAERNARAFLRRMRSYEEKPDELPLGDSGS